jgi:hypothetical protein
LAVRDYDELSIIVTQEFISERYYINLFEEYDFSDERVMGKNYKEGQIGHLADIALAS